jgi:ABC-2 type transport system permease protein
VKVLHIASRELRSMFSTPVGWLVLCGYLLLTGVFWTYMVENYVLQSQDLVYNPMAAAQLNLTDYLLAPFYGNCAVVLVMMLPAVSMRSFSEEFRQRTMELLATSPVSTAEIVLGKFLGALGYVAVLLLASMHYPIGLYQWGEPQIGVLIGSHLGLLLMSGMLLSMGMLFSSMTSNQIVALVLAFAASLSLMILDWGTTGPDDLRAKLALSTHLADIMQGALKLSDVAYFVLVGAVCLFATHQRLESFRWS